LEQHRQRSSTKLTAVTKAQIMSVVLTGVKFKDSGLVKSFARGAAMIYRGVFLLEKHPKNTSDNSKTE